MSTGDPQKIIEVGTPVIHAFSLEGLCRRETLTEKLEKYPWAERKVSTIPETRERCLEEFSEFSCVLKTVFYRWRNKLGKIRSFLRGKQATGRSPPAQLEAHCSLRYPPGD